MNTSSVAMPGAAGTNGHGSDHEYGLFQAVTTLPDGTEQCGCITNIRGVPGTERRRGTLLLVTAGLLLLLLAVAQGLVSWRAQYSFVLHAKGVVWASALEALGLDLGAVIFALLALAKAVRGQQARVERLLNLACCAGSIMMNVLAGDLGSPRSVIIYALPSVLYAACSDRLIATVASHCAEGAPGTSVWAYVGPAARYVLRLLLAPPSTALGLRRMALAAAPLPDGFPAGPEQKAIEMVEPGAPASGKATLLEMYHQHPAAGVRAKVAAVAAELAPRAGLKVASAKTALYAHLRQAES